MEAHCCKIDGGPLPGNSASVSTVDLYLKGTYFNFCSQAVRTSSGATIKSINEYWPCEHVASHRSPAPSRLPPYSPSTCPGTAGTALAKAQPAWLQQEGATCLPVGNCPLCSTAFQVPGCLLKRGQPALDPRSQQPQALQ